MNGRDHSPIFGRSLNIVLDNMRNTRQRIAQYMNLALYQSELGNAELARKVKPPGLSTAGVGLAKKAFQDLIIGQYFKLAALQITAESLEEIH